MNNVSLSGRLTRDPDVRVSNGGSSVARYTLAVDRRYKQENGPTADFIGCVAFGKTAEFIEKYFFKGMKMDMTGRIQTGSYTKEDGTKVYTTDVVAENVEFGESRRAAETSGSGSSGQNAANYGPPDDDGFMDIPDGIDEELPFN